MKNKPKATTVAVPDTIRGLGRSLIISTSMGASVFYYPNDIATRALIGENGDIGHSDPILKMLDGFGEAWLSGAELEVEVKIVKKGKPKVNPWTGRRE